MANSWMQTPAGYTLQSTPHGTIALMSSFGAVVFTPSFLANLCHIFVSAWLVGSSLILSSSAWYLLKRRHLELATASIKVALPVFTLLQYRTGLYHWVLDRHSHHPLSANQACGHGRSVAG